ncbi:response regulator transcription factor [Streptomyces asiaticus]
MLEELAIRLPQDIFAELGGDRAQRSCETFRFLRRSALSWRDGQLGVSLRYAAAAATAVRCEEQHEFCQLAQFWYVALLIGAGQLETAQGVLGAVETRSDDSVSQSVAAVSHVLRGKLLLAVGSIDASIDEINIGLEIAQRCRIRSLRPPSYVTIALGTLRRADMRSCFHFVDKLAEEAQLGYFGQAAGAWVTAQAMEARSGVASAAGLIDGIVTNPLVLRQLLVSEPAAASWLVRAADKLGAQDLAERSVAAAIDTSVRNQQFSVIRGSALHAAGQLEGDSCKLREAAYLYPDRWCVASAKEDLAGVLAKRCSERTEAIGTLKSALETYTAVSSPRDASRVAGKLREFGVRRGAIRTVECEGLLLSGASNRSQHGLTNTEFAVAELVSQGFTNNEVGRQLFISQHTVAFHLKKVFQKLNVASRVELAANWKMT